MGRFELGSYLDLINIVKKILFSPSSTYYAFTIYLHFYDFLPLKKVAMVVMLLFMPDSPKYLIAESKTLEARKALQWFRGPQFDVDEELRQISESHEEESKIGSVTFKELLSKRVYWQPFLIAMFGMFGQQFCGINVVFFYQQTIFEKAHSSIDPSKSRKLLKYVLETSTNDVNSTF